MARKSGVELMRKLSFTTATNRMAEAIMSHDDPDLVLAEMARIVGETLELDRTLIYDVTHRTDEAVGLCEWLNPGAEVSATKATYPLAAFRSTADELARSRMPHESHASTPSASLVADGADELLHGGMAIRSLYWHPFGFRDDGYFLLAFNQVRKERRFDVAELEFVRVVAEYVSLALMKITLTRAVRRGADELRSSEERYRALSENAPSMFFTADAAGSLLSANRTALEHLGYRADDIMGLPIDQIVEPEDRGAFHRWLASCFQNLGTTTRCELRTLHHDGSVLWTRASGRCARGIEGDNVAFLIFDDITEQRRAEQAMLQAQKLESIGLLAGGVAHDFNNLLVGVIGSADVALASLPGDSATRPIIEQILVAGRHAAGLAAQLLAYAGRAQPRIESIDLDALAAEMVDLLRLSMPKAVELVLDLDPTTPFVDGDRTQLRQVLMNLVVNAGEAIGDRAGRVLVRTRVVPREALSRFGTNALVDPSYVILEVTDSGEGMEGATQARIFDPFFSTKRTGRGLGLAAVLGIVRGHRGAILVSSERNRGSTFEAAFPQGQRPVERPSASPMAAIALPAEMRHVLVVDDDAVVRFVADLMLRHLGVEVLAAADRATARGVFDDRSVRVDCVLLDLTMPQGGGQAVLEDLRSRRPDVPVLLMSGYSETDVTNTLGAKIVGFLQKPFTLEQLRVGLATTQTTRRSH